MREQGFMEYAKAKAAFSRCPELAGIEEGVLASLFWWGEERKFERGERVYEEGDAFDGAMFIFLEGQLAVSQNGAAIGTVSAPLIVGAVAIFGSEKKRTATVEVVSEKATALRIALTREELKAPPLKVLEGRLGTKTWAQVVEDQNRKVR